MEEGTGRDLGPSTAVGVAGEVKVQRVNGRIGAKSLTDFWKHWPGEDQSGRGVRKPSSSSCRPGPKECP